MTSSWITENNDLYDNADLAAPKYCSLRSASASQAWFDAISSSENSDVVTSHQIEHIVLHLDMPISSIDQSMNLHHSWMPGNGPDVQVTVSNPMPRVKRGDTMVEMILVQHQKIWTWLLCSAARKMNPTILRIDQNQCIPWREQSDIVEVLNEEHSFCNDRLELSEYRQLSSLYLTHFPFISYADQLLTKQRPIEQSDR